VQKYCEMATAYLNTVSETCNARWRKMAAWKIET